MWFGMVIDGNFSLSNKDYLDCWDKCWWCNCWQFGIRVDLVIDHLYSRCSRNLFVQSQRWKCTNFRWNLFQVNNKNVNDVELVSLLLTLSRFHILLWCFHCWFWTGKYRLVMLLKVFTSPFCFVLQEGSRA